VGNQGKISYDTSKPDGSPRKWMDSNKLNRLGWNATIPLDAGLELAYADMLKQLASK